MHIYVTTQNDLNIGRKQYRMVVSYTFIIEIVSTSHFISLVQFQIITGVEVYDNYYANQNLKNVRACFLA